MAAPITPLQLRPADASFMSTSGLQALNTFLRQAQQATANGLTLSQNLNASAIDVTVTIAAAWQTPSYTSSWVNFSAAQAGRFQKLSDGTVVLGGAIKSGTLSASAFTLPVGYRPSQTINVPVVSFSVIGNLAINTDGTVVPGTLCNNAFVALDGAEFPASDSSPISNLAAPVTLKHGLAQGRCTDLWVTNVVNTGATRDPNPAVTPTWKDDGAGSVVLSALLGLAPGKTYGLRLLCLGEPA